MTPLGFLMLPIGVAGLFLSKKWLYRLFVFWTLFSATSVANFGEGENGSALQAWMFFGVLWLLRLSLDRLTMLSISVDRRIMRPAIWIAVFLVAASISLIMPVYINGRLQITSPILGDGSQTPLYLTPHNITQLLYLIFGGVIAICVAASNLGETERHETQRIIFYSAIFVAAWGIFQFLCNVTGIPYPDFIFNNSGSASGKGYLQMLEDAGVGRVSSVAVEPSMFAQSLVTLLPLSLAAWFRVGSVFSIRGDRWCSGLLVIALILSASSTAYVGLFLLAVLIVPLLIRTRMMSMAKGVRFALFMITAMIGFGALVVASVPVLRGVADSLFFSKANSASAIERAMTVTLAFGYFEQYPILGIGWGSAGSHDLLVKLLSNVGIVGTLPFLGAMLSVLRSNWRAIGALVDPESLSRAVCFLCLAIFLATSILIEFPLAFGNFWLLLGLAISTSWKPGARPVVTRQLEPA